MKLPVKRDITIEILEEIYKRYNPLGQKHNFLVDDFLEWSKKEGDYYWIWGGALEWVNLGIGVDPKDIIKELPFLKVPTEYRNLLVEAWLRYLNDNETHKETILKEYTTIMNNNRYRERYNL